MGPEKEYLDVTRPRPIQIYRYVALNKKYGFAALVTQVCNYTLLAWIRVKEMSKSIFTAEELRKLTTRKNAAIAYRGKVYDVTGFLDRHPGGSEQLLLAAGRDVTHLFNSYHSKQTRRLIAEKCKYLGELEGLDKIPKFPEKDELFEALEQRIQKYFKSNKIDPKWHTTFFSAVIAINLATLLFWCMAIFSVHLGYSLLISSSLALLSGFSSALVLLNFGHNITHFAMTHKPWVWQWATGFMTCVTGWSGYVWIYQHVIGHHVYPNHGELDPDASTKKIDFWKIKPFQDWCPHYVYQHIYMPILFTFISVKMKFQDFHSMIILKKANVPINPPSFKVLLFFILPKVVHVYYRIILPYPYVPLSSLVLLNLISEMIMGFWLGVITQVSHVNTDVIFPNPDSSSYDITWSKMQVATTVDYATDSVLWGVFSGGLNSQVAHHLFPGILSCHYKEITPIVRKTCAEFGVQYNSYGSMREMWSSHTNYLKTMGQKKMI